MTADEGVMLSPCGDGDTASGRTLSTEMIKEFSGAEDVAKADILVLRGLGLTDVQVRDAGIHVIFCRHSSVFQD